MTPGNNGDNPSANSHGMKEVRFMVSDLAWTSATITGKTVVFYKKVGDGTHNDTTSPLIGYITYDQNVSSTAGTWTADVDAAAAHGGAAGVVDVTPVA